MAIGVFHVVLCCPTMEWNQLRQMEAKCGGFAGGLTFLKDIIKGRDIVVPGFPMVKRYT